MCGINGIVALEQGKELLPSRNLRSVLNLMNEKISHRGPDSEGIFIKNQVGFGFRRLSIIDLSTSANQPMLSDNEDVVLVFNGEIYNYIEVKAVLMAKGYSFRTDSDTEVILKSYLEYGDECVNHFNGMWAFAIYDFRKQRLFCSRDRMGVKPFYYTIQDNALFFSSELKALHAVFNFTKANLNKVYEYLAYGYRINDGDTFFESCFELLPGTNLIIENGQLSQRNYWRLKEQMYTHNGLNYQDEYTRLFESAVKLRYRSDVPVALLLSGGLDSSSIAKVTDDLIESGELAQNEINAYIASFPNFEDDETAIAREFVKTCKHIKLNELQINTKNVVSDFDNLIYDLDHPLSSFASVVHNNLMKACRQEGIKVVLNGQGSDEAFAGYDRYISGVHLLDRLLSNPRSFTQEFWYLNQKNNYSIPFLLTQMAKSTLNQSYASYLRAKYQEKSIPCLNPDFVDKSRSHYVSEYYFSLKGDNFNRYLLNVINHQGLNNILHYEDVSSMQQSIEIRSPFMDYRLVEFAFSIPNELKYNLGRTKLIQRETIGKKLPDNITNNRRKIGFKTPFSGYISNDPNVKAYVFDVLNSTSFRSKGIWKADRIVERFENTAKYPQFPFWRVLNLEIWSKVYGIDNL
ncbi:MAG: asparagine synthase (glutamine-hydrolyzing) [Haliscomenobacter sp.]|nr:asparagine synthase (glutamine-hydrolyzing) [Haliscomenobacter sp.]MBK9492569.1 asparagine synthase (glutamine-hydrolyzing) [Haliscomenobacter sp.]